MVTYTSEIMKTPTQEESPERLSPRVILQVVAAAVIVIALVALAGGYFDQSPSPRPVRAITPPPPIASTQAPVPAPSPVPAAEDDSPVSATLDPPTYEFGFLRPSESRTRTLTVTNRETMPIRLKGTWRGCTCTTLDVQAGLLEPGESREVAATLTAGLTPTTKDSTVKLEVVGRPPIILPMKGEIIRGVRARPRDISTYSYRGAEGNYRPRGAVTLDAPEGVPFRILAINGEPQSTEPSLQHVIPWDVTAFDATSGLDPLGQSVPRFWLIETDHPDTPVMELRVSHRANAIEPRGDRPWFFTELYVNAGGVGPDGSAIFTLPIKGLSGLNASKDIIEGVRSDSEQFSAKLRSIKPEGRDLLAEIAITPSPGTRGAIEGDLIVEGKQFSAPLRIIATTGRAAR